MARKPGEETEMVKGETRIELSLVLGVLLCPVLSGIAFADETGALAKEDMLAATASPASSHKQEIL